MCVQDALMFRKYVQEIFGLKDEPRLSQASGSQKSYALERVIADKAFSEYGLYPNKNWVEKCMQIYTLSNNYDGKQRRRKN